MASATSSFLALALLAGCGSAMDAPATVAPRRAKPGDGLHADGGVAREDEGPCPREMSLVDGSFCIDRWEAGLEELTIDGGARPWSPHLNPGELRVRAVSRAGVLPQGYICGEQAARACGLSGKRLCTSREWLAACRGPRERAFPYGDNFVRGRCNVGRWLHPVVQYFGRTRRVFTFINMNNAGINLQRDTVAPAGAFHRCVSPWGVYDLVGNLHEWVADRGGTFRGGFYGNGTANSAGCYYATRFHGITYRDYSTGFRCCADPR